MNAKLKSVIGAGVVCGLSLFYCVPAHASSRGASQTPHLIPLKESETVGRPHFPIGDTSRGGQGKTIDHIPAQASMNGSYHVHAHLSLIYNGRQIAVPAGIGIVDPNKLVKGFISGGRKVYWLHTHDASGIIHVESPVFRKFTLGQFFAIWGEPLSKHDIAGFRGPVHVFVNGSPYSKSLTQIPLSPYSEITLEIGKHVVAPPLYNFPPEL